MFFKSKTTSGSKAAETPKPAAPKALVATSPKPNHFKAPARKIKPPASVLSSDLHIIGTVKTIGDIQVDGTVEGNVHADLLCIGESGAIKGEVVARDLVVNGHIVGNVRSLKIHLTTTARVQGDIIHKTLAIENGACFEGSAQHQDDPLIQKDPKPKPKSQPAPRVEAGKGRQVKARKAPNANRPKLSE